MIQVNNISKSYNDFQVINNMSLKIERKALTAIIGPNGSGKSTLLSIISRLLTHDDGNIEVNGKNVKDYKSRELGQTLSIMRQTNHIDMKLTIRELVAFGRFPYTQGHLTIKDEMKIDSAIDYLDLADIQHKYIDELSGGQRQRAFLAMVVAQDTEYILLDEPLNNLDMKHSVQIMKTLRKLVDELGKTIVVVLHDINFASCYSDYIIALKDGEIANYDQTHKVINPEILKELFDIDFNVDCINGNHICNYFNLQ